MRDYGMVFYDEKRKEYAESGKRLSGLYLGETPRPMDFFMNYDIRRLETEGLAQRIADSGGCQQISLFGDAYVGKTCAAIRLGLDLSSHGYEFAAFPMTYGMTASDYRRHVLEFLAGLPAGTKFALLTEGAPYYYGMIRRILEGCPKNIGSLVLICTGDTSDHRSKRYLLDELPNCTELEITEKTADSRFANSIYDKLEAVSHLNKLRTYGSTRKECVKYIREVNDLIEVLYIAQEGRYFVSHFSELISGKKNDDNKQAFLYLCLLSKLGISEMPVMLLPDILRRCGIQLRLADFREEYRDVIRIQGDQIALRCSRLLWASGSMQMTDDLMQEWIYNSACYFGKNLQEREDSLFNELFQKLLKEKNLRAQIRLKNEQILSVLLKLEPYCKHLSYYWVQRGMLHRDMEHFEEANNALSEAAAIRNNTSYHICHAQAKNYMAWGVWSVKNDPGREQYYFGIGKELLLDLIQNASSRYFAYSTHTFVDMMMRYYRELEQRPADSDMQMMADLLHQLIVLRNDRLGSEIGKRFLDYSASVGFCSEETRSLASVVSGASPASPVWSMDADDMDGGDEE